jgi:Leucine-rich repeat (LRR) protein
MNRNILVYENDLKFKQLQQINFNNKNLKIYGGNIDKNYDTIDSRLEECTKNNGNYLDLSQLDLVNINNLFNSTFNYNNITYLFLNNNNLCGVLNLSKFNNLISLDVGHNNIFDIKVPSNLKELVINNNGISKLPTNINLSRLECSYNNLFEIPNYTNLELLYCNNNNINNIKYYVLLRKLIAHDNPLNTLEVSPEISYLDISVTPLLNIDIFPNLEHLVANSCKLKSIPNIPRLHTLELINTPVERIQFFPKIETILCSIHLTKHISSKYSNTYNISLRNNSVICISIINN